MTTMTKEEFVSLKKQYLTTLHEQLVKDIEEAAVKAENINKKQKEFALAGLGNVNADTEAVLIALDIYYKVRLGKDFLNVVKAMSNLSLKDVTEELEAENDPKNQLTAFA